MEDMVTIPAGSLLTITTGHYSSYSVQGVFRATADIDAGALLQEWKAQYLQRERQEEETDDEYGHLDEEIFLAWVSRKGLLEPVDCFEWHFGDLDYGGMDVEEMRNRIPA